MTIGRGQALLTNNLDNELSKNEIGALKEVAQRIRRNRLVTVAEAGSGHSGGSLSETDILTTLYYSILANDPSNPSLPSRDRFILSKAHACPALYTVLADRGYFPMSDLSSFRKIDSHLQGHTKIGTPGIEMSGGSLGMGLSFGIGIALAGRVDSMSHETYVLLGDGECDEGQVWEAAMSASHYRLDTITAIVDRNGIQNDRFTHEVMELEPLAQKWRAFGWKVLTVNGHSIPALYKAFMKAKKTKGQPAGIIAKTTKGKGVSFMENNPGFHGKAPSWDELAVALSELGAKPEGKNSAWKADMLTMGYTAERVSSISKAITQMSGSE